MIGNVKTRHVPRGDHLNSDQKKFTWVFSCLRKKEA